MHRPYPSAPAGPRRPRRLPGLRETVSRSPGPWIFALVLALLLAACGPDDDEVARDASPVAVEEPVATGEGDVPIDASTPLGDYGRLDPERLERERLDDAWRAAAQRQLAGRETRSGAVPGAGRASVSGRAMESEVPVERMRRAGSAEGSSAGAAADATSEEGAPAADTAASDGSGAQSWEAITPDSVRGTPTLPVATSGGGPTVVRLQWMLDRARFSPGVIDGRWGKNTAKAVYWLQHALGEEPTGRVDRALWDRLEAAVGGEEVLVEHRLTAEDVEGPFVDVPDDYRDQADLDCLCYGSAEEKVAERFHATPELLAQLNPGVDLDALAAGDRLWVPNVPAPERPMERVAGTGSADASDGAASRPADADRIEKLVISNDGYYLHAVDAEGEILYHFPTTVGSGYDPSPSGELRITGLAWDPEFHYQPKLFSEVPDTEEEEILPPGPNSPVGVLWVQLSKESYGIHGTAAPESIGYTTSHGCIRLTNWDATFLGTRVAQGVPVEFVGGAGAAGDQSGPAAGGSAPARGERPASRANSSS